MRLKFQQTLMIVLFSVSINYVRAQHGGFEERSKNLELRNEETIVNAAVMKIKLEDLDLLSTIMPIGINETIQLVSTGEFLKPTQSLSALEFSIDDGAESAVIDQNGILMGISLGCFTIKVCNTIDLATKMINAKVVEYASTKNEDLTEKMDISIYPKIVRSGESIRVLTNGVIEATIIVYAISGAMINEKENTSSIETTGFVQGIYLAVIKVGDKFKIEKFIIR